MSTKKQWTCGDCGEVHANRDVDTGMQLRMPHMPANQRELKHYIRSYFEPEDVEIACECNGESKDRTRETFITVGPEILVVQMVRMVFDPKRGKDGEGVKLTANVPFTDHLDLSEHTTPLAGDERNLVLRYRLHGVVSHSGPSTEGGHYVAMVKGRNGSEWVRVDDETLQKKLNKRFPIFRATDLPEWQSYMLVYQKVGGKMAKCI
jgi:uncharacterized UBP type Zn finger protein